LADEPEAVPGDAIDEVQANNQSTEQARRKREDADVIRKLLHDKNGRAWLYRLLERCHIYEHSFFGEETHTTAYRLGEENIGKRLMLEVIDASGDLYITMIREQKEDEARLAKLARKAADKAEGRGEPPLTPSAQMPDLPPPPGWPGYKPPPAKPKAPPASGVDPLPGADAD
jgi:hypothetical protein